MLDHDAIFKGRVTAAIKDMGMKRKLISYRSPWQNGAAERSVKTLREELFDHVVVFNEKHLRRLVLDYVAYYNDDRRHLSVDKDAPVSRPVRARPSAKTTVVALPRVGMPRRADGASQRCSEHGAGMAAGSNIATSCALIALLPEKRARRPGGISVSGIGQGFVRRPRIAGEVTWMIDFGWRMRW